MAVGDPILEGVNFEIVTNPKAMAQGVAMTAAASASNGIAVADDDDIDFATGNFAPYFNGLVPDFTPAANLILLQKLTGGVGYQLEIVATTGLVRLTLNATAYNSSVAPTAVDGTKHQIVTVVTVGAVNTTVDFYFDGRPLGTQQTAANPGTVSNAANLYILGTSAVRTAGTVSDCATLNFAPTAAEVLDMYRNGIPESWKWGSQTAKFSDTAWTGATGSTPPTGWSLNQNGTFTIFDSGDGAPYDACIKIAVNATPDYDPGIYKGYALQIGKIYTVSVWFKHGTSTKGEITIGTTVGGSQYLDAYPLTDATWTKYSITFTATAATVYVGLNVYSHTAEQYDLFDEVYIYEIGPTLALEPEGIQPSPGQWLDSSSNKNHAMQPATGSSLVRLKKEFEFRWTNTWTASSAAQYIGGLNQVVLSTKHFITSIVSRATVVTDVENIEIGDGSAVAYYVAAIAPTAIPIIHTLAKNLNDGTNLKLVVTPAASATMTVETIIKGYLLE